jgi:NDP-sugar pyrophosphorylase family protein
MSLPVAILAGGLATRLYPLTLSVPKSLLEIAGRPFVAHQIEWLVGEGFSRIVLCLGKHGEMVQEAVRDGSSLGARVDYAFDGPRLLGTGGALRAALDRLGPAFLVMYGDSYLRCDLRAVERAFLDSGLPALMTVFRNDGRFDRSNVRFDAGRILCYDKRRPTPEMRHIDYGLGGLRREALLDYPAEAAFDLADVYGGLAQAGRLAAFEATDRFYEIGSPEGLDETRHFLQNKGGL